MMNLMKRVCSQNNPASWIAYLCGFLCAVAIPHILALTLVRWLHSSVTMIWVAYGINGFLTLVGCLYFVSMPRVGSFVKDVQGFFRDVKFAFVTTLAMPIMVTVILFLTLIDFVTGD